MTQTYTELLSLFGNELGGTSHTTHTHTHTHIQPLVPYYCQVTRPCPSSVISSTHTHSTPHDHESAAISFCSALLMHFFCDHFALNRSQTRAASEHVPPHNCCISAHMLHSPQPQASCLHTLRTRFLTKVSCVPPCNTCATPDIHE